MRWLAIVSALLIAGCSSAPTSSPARTVVAVHPPAALARPWLVPKPSDEVVLFDTRTLQALRKLDETEALNANGTGRVARPGLWIGVGFGAFTVGYLVADDIVEDTSETIVNCLFSALFASNCD